VAIRGFGRRPDRPVDIGADLDRITRRPPAAPAAGEARTDVRLREATSLGLGAQIRAKSSMAGVAPGSSSAVGQWPAMSSHMRLPYTNTSAGRASALNASCSSSSTVTQSIDPSASATNPSSDTDIE
jgi:hypothetical protein